MTVWINFAQDGKKDNNPNSDWEHKLGKHATMAKWTTYIHNKSEIYKQTNKQILAAAQTGGGYKPNSFFKNLPFCPVVLNFIFSLFI